MADNPIAESKIKALKLADSVLAASRAGRVSWSEVKDADAFYTRIAGRAFTVRSDDGDASHPFTIWVAESGDILESVNTLDDQVSDDALGKEVPEWEKLISDLYFEARKRGTKINQIIDTMQAELNQKAREDDIPF